MACRSMQPPSTVVGLHALHALSVARMEATEAIVTLLPILWSF